MTSAKVEELDRIIYEIQSVAGDLTVLKMRILEEFPDKPYGRPPQLLSKPFTISQGNSLLKVQSKHLGYVVKRLENLEFREGNANL